MQKVTAYTMTIEDIIKTACKPLYMHEADWLACFGETMGAHYLSKFINTYEKDSARFWNYIDRHQAQELIEYKLLSAEERACIANEAREAKRQASPNKRPVKMYKNICNKHRCDMPNNGRSFYCDNHDNDTPNKTPIGNAFYK